MQQNEQMSQFKTFMRFFAVAMVTNPSEAHDSK